MPATLVHPLFALPFRRLGLPTSALVMGAMAPDVAYVVPTPSWGLHNLLGIFAFALPVGLFALFAYHRLVAPTLGFSDRFDFGPPTRFLRIALAVVVGATTHVVVDAFTHGHGWGVDALPILRTKLLTLPVYKWLQYGLSALGCVVLAHRGRHLLRRWLVDGRVQLGLLALAVVALIYAVAGAIEYRGLLGVRVFVVRAVASSLVLAALALLANGVRFAFASRAR